MRYIHIQEIYIVDGKITNNSLFYSVEHPKPTNKQTQQIGFCIKDWRTGLTILKEIGPSKPHMFYGTI